MATPPVVPPPPRRHGTLILIIVFILGLIAGGGAMYGWAPRLHRRDRRRQPLHVLLQLDSGQQKQFDAVLATLRQHYGHVHAAFAPQYRQFHRQEEALRRQEFDQMQPFRDQADNQIRAFLNPDQRAKFDRWLAEFHRRHPAPAPPAKPSPTNSQR